jgi:hypothetical protein
MRRPLQAHSPTPHRMSTINAAGVPIVTTIVLFTVCNINATQTEVSALSIQAKSLSRALHIHSSAKTKLRFHR